MKPIQIDGTTYLIESRPDVTGRNLIIQGDASGFEGKLVEGVFHAPLNAHNASALRARLPWLQPKPLGLATSFGFGDRLGLATPGHISAVRGTGVAPIFAQQSVRENTRTNRTPQIVLDDAMWALFEADWREPWGADADHVKEISDLPPFIQSDYSFYTIDPNEYVDNAAHTDPLEVLKGKALDLPWESLHTSFEDLSRQYLARPISLNGIVLEYSQETFLRAAAKYGRAIAHIKSLSDYLLAHVAEFDLEASVDETDTPTSPEEHYFIASQLRRLGVPIVSLAPRFIGSFEKGVDYIGDLDVFEREMEKHAAVMHAVGGYKISIHTGSDKFSIYPSVARWAHNLVHVKTAGTSYLEALRVLSVSDKKFFREIVDFARSRYNADRVTYHVSGQLEKVPPAAALRDDDLSQLFEQFDARQVLHVTFGSVLDHYGPRLKACLHANLDLYEQCLHTHFKRHLAPFHGQDGSHG